MYLVISEDDYGTWLQLEGENAAEWQMLDDLAASGIRTCGPGHRCDPHAALGDRQGAGPHVPNQWARPPELFVSRRPHGGIEACHE